MWLRRLKARFPEATLEGLGVPKQQVSNLLSNSSRKKTVLPPSLPHNFHFYSPLAFQAGPLEPNSFIKLLPTVFIFLLHPK